MRIAVARGTSGHCAQPSSKLLKSTLHDNYTSTKVPVKQVSLISAKIDEPTHERVVPLLEALPREDADFYADEANVVDWSDKSAVLFSEIEERYGFVGGSTAEYTAYFRRSDLPRQMWHFALARDVKAVAGFSVVSKRDPEKQRKLLMMCAANYAWCDARPRAEHGLHGGGALARMWVPSDHLSVSSFDESNAFTSVLMPK